MEKFDSGLQSLLPEDIAEFKRLSTPMRIKAGTILFVTGDPSKYVYYIERGYVKLFHNTNSGKISLVSFRKTGELLGVASVLNGQSNMSAGTIGACKMWRLDGNIFREVLHQRPALAVRTAAIMSRRMQDLEKVIVQLTSAEIEHRLAWLLLDLAAPVLNTGQAGNGIDIQLTHQDLASMIGSCRQTVTTTLGKFKNDGVIKMEKRYIEIINREKLQQYLI